MPRAFPQRSVAESHARRYHKPVSRSADINVIIKGMDGAISAVTVTYDFERLMKAEGDTQVRKVKCSEFGEAVVKHMG